MRGCEISKNKTNKSARAHIDFSGYAVIVKACVRILVMHCAIEIGTLFTFFQPTQLAKMNCSCISRGQPCYTRCVTLNLPDNYIKGTYVCGELSYTYVNFVSRLSHGSNQLDVSKCSLHGIMAYQDHSAGFSGAIGV